MFWLPPLFYFIIIIIIFIIIVFYFILFIVLYCIVFWKCMRRNSEQSNTHCFKSMLQGIRYVCFNMILVKKLLSNLFCVKLQYNHVYKFVATF